MGYDLCDHLVDFMCSDQKRLHKNQFSDVPGLMTRMPSSMYCLRNILEISENMLHVKYIRCDNLRRVANYSCVIVIIFTEIDYMFLRLSESG